MEIKPKTYLHQGLTQQIIGAFYDVYNQLGYGFLEKVYENALAYELGKRGFQLEQQRVIKVYYRGVLVGNYVADLIIEDVVLIETKAVKTLKKIHAAQLNNYLSATSIELGLLLNFGLRPQVKRLIFSNDRKPNLKFQNQ